MNNKKAIAMILYGLAACFIILSIVLLCISSHITSDSPGIKAFIAGGVVFAIGAAIQSEAS